MYKKEEKKPTEDLCILVASTNNDGHYYGNSHTYNVPLKEAEEATKVIEIAYEKLGNIRPVVFFGGVIQGNVGSGLTKDQLIERIAREHNYNLEEAQNKISGK